MCIRVQEHGNRRAPEQWLDNRDRAIAKRE